MNWTLSPAIIQNSTFTRIITVMRKYNPRSTISNYLMLLNKNYQPKAIYYAVSGKPDRGPLRSSNKSSV
jgi:hypothetical protein